MENSPRSKVGIVIATMNRPDFIVRQLEYYTKVKCPHPIYVGDASNAENRKKAQLTIEKLSKYLTINYYIQPENCLISESRPGLYNKVKEEYCVFSGDDDYQIPDSLTKCAEFLEKNPDYSSASGYSVSFRLVNDGVYGELRRLSDYPRYQIESPRAAQRLIDSMTKFTIPEFSVQRTKHMIKYWLPNTMKDRNFCTDILPSAMSSVLGKSKIIDCLSLIRQVDNQKRTALNTFDWITKKDFSSSYETFCEILAKEISAIDDINLDEARKAPKQAVWSYLNVNLPVEYKKIYDPTNDGKKRGGNLLRRFRLHLGQNLPWLKNIYLRTTHSIPNAPRQIFYEVTQPSSPYYKDFQPIFNSFGGKYNKS